MLISRSAGVLMCNVSENCVTGNLHPFQSACSPDEYFVPELDKLFKDERVQSMWESITTFDPLGGLTSSRRY